MDNLISIVIPVYNEEENVEILYEEIRDTVNPFNRPFEIIFVDDGSLDDTFEYLKGIQLKEKGNGKGSVKTRIVKLSRNFGQTAAMQAGFDHARGNIIITMDGDLQNDPNDISKLLDKLDEGHDMVCGWRKDRMDKAVTRILPSKTANWLIGKITGLPVHDTGCSLKAYRDSVIKSARFYSDMHRFIPAMINMGGGSMTEMVVNHRPRKYGKTKYGLSRIWKVLFDIITIKMLLHFRQTPMWWFAMLGLIFYFLGLCFGVGSVILFIKGEQTVVYPAASFLFFSLFGSFLSWGLITEFIVRIER